MRASEQTLEQIKVANHTPTKLTIRFVENLPWAGRDERGRVAAKHERQKAYATKYLSNFENHHFQFWSPVVPVGYLTTNLAQISGLELIINGEYKRRIEQLRERAKKETHDARNPVFRMLQILEHMRD